ncbi:MAG: hypothetical protein WCI72_02615 [archaeon]
MEDERLKKIEDQLHNLEEERKKILNLEATLKSSILEEDKFVERVSSVLRDKVLPVTNIAYFRDYLNRYKEYQINKEEDFFKNNLTYLYALPWIDSEQKDSRYLPIAEPVSICPSTFDGYNREFRINLLNIDGTPSSVFVETERRYKKVYSNNTWLSESVKCGRIRIPGIVALDIKHESGYDKTEEGDGYDLYTYSINGVRVSKSYFNKIGYLRIPLRKIESVKF